MPRRIDSAPRMTGVRERLERMIREQNLSGRRLLGYRQLAARLGACQQTLQRALAAMEADGLIERRHGSGTYVLDARQRRARAAAASLALVVRSRLEPGAWSPVAEIIAGVEAQAERVRTSCRLYAWDEPADAELLAGAREMRAHSAFIMPRFGEPLLVSRLLALRAGPVVLVDEPSRGLPVIAVNDDTFNGARAVTWHLLELGHRRIGFLDVGDREQWNSAKHGGYLAAMKEAGLAADASLVAAPALGVPALSPDAPRLVDEAVGRLLSLAEPPTAIFAYDDQRALFVLESLRSRRLKPGRDIALAGFGDTASRYGTCDGLTSCRIDFRKLGREAVRAALAPVEPGVGREILVPDRLVVRASTGAASATGRSTP
jgi:DNA-binding LacI/PurR family transcriptional regulator